MVGIIVVVSSRKGIARITALKNMGFALADIIEILEIYDDKEKLDVFLVERQEELEHAQ